MKKRVSSLILATAVVLIGGCATRHESNSDKSARNPKDGGADAVSAGREDGSATADSGDHVTSYSYDGGAVIPPAPPAAVKVALSKSKRITSFDLSDQDLEMVKQGNQRFALDMYKKLVAEETPNDNLIFSPYSISVALATAYAGARGRTEEQMAQVLHFTLEQERLHPVFNYLALELAERAKPAPPSDSGGEVADAGNDENSGFQLNIANATWPQEDYTFLPEYLDLLAKYYGSALYLLDYIHDTEGSRLIINGWVADRTEQKIKELIPAGVLIEDTRLVLTNAVYFKAAWVNHFNASDTYDGAFYRSDSSAVTVPMMKQEYDLPYAEGQTWQAVEIPYERKELSMVLIVPKSTSNLAELEASLNYQHLFTIIDALTVHKTAISLPKFSFNSPFSLKDTLMALGMIDAFGGGADFSGITGSRDLYIDKVLHQAFIAVDEAGTEAAAATAVIFVFVDGGGFPRAEITLDRPFIFLIWDKPTGAFLFLGRVADPS